MTEQITTDQIVKGQIMSVRYPLALPVRLSLEGFAGRCGLHPDLVGRFVALGLVPASRDAGGRLWFDPAQLTTVARIQRLRAGLSLNYAALGLVLELLDRIGTLEDAARSRQRSAPPWM